MIRCKSKRFLAVLLSVLVIFELMATVLFSTSADDANTKTITKNLVDLSNSQVAVDIEDSQWPAGIVKMTADDTYAYNSNATVDIAEDIDGEKFLKFNFDQAKQVGNNDYIAERTSGHKFFVKVSVPVNYIPYLKDFKVDMLYNYKQASGSTTDNRKQAYYVLGVKDGVAWGKDVRSHYSIAPTNAATVDEQKTVKFSEIKKLTSNVSLQSYLKNTTGYVEAPTYTTTDLENASSMEILVMFSAPEITAAMRNRGYFFGIKNISITLEGPADRIDNIDKPATIDPSIVNFEEGNTLAEITAATGFNPQPRGELVTEGAHSGTNAYLYRRKQGTSGVDYDTRVGVKIDKKKSQHSQGVTFMYKNISDVKVNFRLWFAVGNAAEGTNDAKIGKYHYQFEAPAGMTEYQRVTVYWNNIGLTDYTHGGFSGGSSSGHAIPQSDINSGINIKIIQNGLSIDDAGVLFDTFEAVTDEFIAARNLSLVDFENCDEGVNDLPEGVSIAGDYKGSYEIVKTGDKKALRVNYDLPGTAKTESSSQWHQLINRHTFEFNIQIPKKILKDVQQIAYIVKTNAPAHSDDRGTNTYYQTILKGYDISFKSGESARIFTQNRNVTASVTISPNSSSTYGYTASHYAYNWLNKNNAIAMTEEYLEELTTVSLYVAVPICNGTEGYWFELDDIILEFAEPPVNQETLARDIFTSKNNEAVVGSTITVENKPVSVSDPNHSEFENSYLIKTKAGNTEFVKFNNDLIAYKRNAKPFIDTAVFHMFTKAQADTNMEVTFIDAAGETMSYTFVAPATTKKIYSDVSIPLKAIYDAYVAANPEGLFNLTDIRSIGVRPVVDSDSEVYIALPQILTNEFISSSEDPEKLKNVNLVNFDNVESLDELPLGLKVNDGYSTLELVKRDDGTKALRFNYSKAYEIDRKIDYGQIHQIVNRKTNQFTVNVPTNSLKGLKKIKFTVNANVPKFDDSNRYPNTYYQTVVGGNGVNFKAGQSAMKYTQEIGVENVIEFDLHAKNTVGSASASSMANWLNPEGALKVDDTFKAGFTTIYIVIGVPECTGAEGYWFELSSIDLEFESEPTYEESESRTIVNGDRYNKVSSGTVKLTKDKLASNDKNYRKFKEFYIIDAKKGNTDPILFRNGNINFLRNAKPFLDTATFRMYVQATADTTLDMALVNFKDEKLPFKLDIKKNKDAALYDEYKVSLREIYDAYMASNPGAKFNLNDLVGIEILAGANAATKLKFAEVSLWSAEAGSGSSAGNFYECNYEDTIRIEGYKNAIPETFTATIQEFKDPVAEIANQDIRIPKGTKPLVMAKFTLKNAAGEIAEPDNNFWISMQVPEGTDVSDIGIYRVFLDGSLVKIRHAIEPNNFITANVFFSMDTFVVLSGVKSGNAPDKDDNGMDYEYEEIIEEDEVTEEEVDQQEEVEEKPEKKKRKKILKKIVTYDEYTWVWILVAVGGGVLAVATGIVIFIILRKKRNNGKETVK